MPAIRSSKLLSSEHELIEHAQAGDRQAFCALAEAYERRIYSLALHYCRDAHDAEDLAQEVWLRAYRALKSFRAEASFYTWLRQIMINAFLNHRRSTTFRQNGETLRPRLLELDAPDSSVELEAAHAYEAETALHDRLLVAQVMQALTELSAQQRLVFLLKHHEGMTYEEIACALGCATGTVKKTLFRAVEKLRARLGVQTNERAEASFAPMPHTTIVS
jgi:RNA polymerase sigma-70 factor, ECF subfamily